MRSNADLVPVLAAIYGAVRRRVRMVQKVKIKLVRRARDELIDVPVHPGLAALHRVNESLTFKQGFGLIEQHKLTEGPSYWIKRRDGLGTPVEFEIWDPRQVEVVPRKDKEWVPQVFRRHKAVGTVEEVAPEDVVWFRHMVDPRNPMRALPPIGAVRVEADTGLEAQRFNQRYFDNNAAIGRHYKVKEGGPAEVERVKQQLRRESVGTDNAYRGLVSEGDVELVDQPISHKDMQFLEQQQWTVEEVARVFELSPITLGDMRHASFENTEQADAHDWVAVADQVDATLAEFTEFYLWPDFGEDLLFMADYSEIPALQGDRKLQAEIDEINLRSFSTVVNEVRERDGKEPVAWGDKPFVPLNVAPLGTIPLLATPGQKQKEAVGEPEGDRARSVESAELAMNVGWARRLKAEMRGIIEHLKAADARVLSTEDVAAYNWDWEARYLLDVARELEILYGASLTATGFVEGPMFPAHASAVQYARRRAGELLSLRGRENVVAWTRERTQRIVAEAIEAGDPMRTVANRIRADFGFSASRADMIAVTEGAKAQGHAMIASYQSQGHEGKEWETAGDDRVCEICEGNAADGEIPLGEPFNSGDDTVPGHPRCRCTLLPVRELVT
jgi:HK97 family phage portal protein